MNKELEKRDIRIALYVRDMMSTESGQDFLQWMFEQTHVYHTSFNTEQSVMSYQEGQRSIGLSLLQVCNVHQGAYIKMLEALHLRSVNSDKPKKKREDNEDESDESDT